MKYRKRGRPRNGEDACGTIRGYHRHYAAREQACLACCNALAQYEEDRRLAPARRELLEQELAIYERRGRYPRKGRLGHSLEADGGPPYGDRREAILEGGAA